MPSVSRDVTWSERWCGAGTEPRHQLMASVGVLRARPWVMALSAAANFVLLRLAQFPTRRFVLLLAISALPLALAIFNGVQARTPQNARAGLSRSLFANDVFVPAVVTVTGGLRSPFMPVLLVNVIVMGVLWRRRRAVHALLIGFAVVTALLAIAPGVVTGPIVPRPYFEVMTALNVVSALYLGVQIMSGVSDGFVSAQQSLSTVRERVVDAAVQRMRSLEQVGSKVAHELKNPLAAVKSLLQLEEEAVAAGKLLEGRAAAAGVRLERTGKGVRMGGDARRLEEALLNVAANAIEATPAGGAVTIHTEHRDGVVAIVVRDTGKGMSAAILEKVGTPFFTTRREGTGLGVVLARTALAQHGGRLEYASRPGQGTTVTLAMPDRLRTAGAVEDEMVDG